MAEWSNAAVLKTVVLYPRDRGFESLFLRQRHQIRPAAVCCGIFVSFRPQTVLAQASGMNETKTARRAALFDAFVASRRGITDERSEAVIPSHQPAFKNRSESGLI